MPKTSIAANFNQSSDVLLDLLSKVSFDLILVIDDFAEFRHVLIRKLPDLDRGIYACPLADFGGIAASDPVEIRKRVKDGFVPREVYT